MILSKIDENRKYIFAMYFSRKQMYSKTNKRLKKNMKSTFLL